MEWVFLDGIRKMDKLYRIKGGKLYEVFRISEDTSTTVTNDGSNNLGNALNKSYNSASPQQRGGTFSVDSKEFDGNDSNNATEVNINAKNPNDANMGNTFKSIVDPILKNIKDQRGISDYRISTYETPETRMERRLPVKIFVKAIEALEYIDIDFVITPEGVSFDEV